MSEIDLDALAPWLGRTETKEDVLTHGPIDKFRATFGPHLCGGAGDVPLGIHWCIALDTVPAAALSDDGHAARGGFLPPVPLPARMWAGGDVTHLTPLKIGEAVTRRSVIGDITAKQGRSGTLVFVTVEHEHSSGGRLCIREKQSIVYREISAPRPVKNAPDASDPTTLRSHVSDTRRQPDPRIDRNRDHAVRPRISRTSASGSYSPLIRIRCPPASSISILPADGAVPGTGDRMVFRC